jgi:hypothetical protein
MKADQRRHKHQSYHLLLGTENYKPYDRNLGSRAWIGAAKERMQMVRERTERARKGAGIVPDGWGFVSGEQYFLVFNVVQFC